MPAGNPLLQRIRQGLAPQEEQEATLQQRILRGVSQQPQDPSVRAAQENEEFGPLWKTLDGVFLTLNELQRPQKALFAGFNAWQTGATTSQAMDVVRDEFMWGIGSGNFKRDVAGIDLIDPEGEGNRSLLSVPGIGGLAIDIILDPINLIPVTKIARGAAWLGRSGASAVGRALDRVPVIGAAKDQVIDGLKDLFIKTAPETAAGRAATEATTRINAFTAEHREVLLDDYIRDNRAWRELAEETGMTEGQLSDFVVEQARDIKLNDPNMLPEALNDTYARIYRDYGVDAFDSFMRGSGRRMLDDERPLRRAILNSKFEDANASLVGRIGRDVTGKLEDLLFEMKERDLERFVFEKTQKVTKTGIPDPVVESMQRDYIMVAATPEFRHAVETLTIGGRRDTGFGFTPFHTSDLHSQIQDIGIDQANELLRTPWRKNPELSEFVMRHPRTGESIHMPLMKQGFHTDPRLIDTVREFYARTAVETSQVLDDLVRGYGTTLADDAFQSAPVEAIRAGTVSARTSTKILGKPAQALTEVPPNFRLTKEAAASLEESGMRMLEGVKGFENVALPKEAADIVMQVSRWQSGSLDQNAVGKTLNFLQNQVWKPATLFFFPGYYIRNTVTNMFFQNMLGMQPTDMAKFTARGTAVLSSGSHANRFRRVGQAVSELAGDPATNRKVFDRLASSPSIVTKGESLASKSVSLQDLVDGIKLDDLPGKDNLGLLHLLTELGVVRSGQYGVGEITRTLEEAATASGRGVTRKLTGLTVNTNPILSTGAEVAQFMEDSQRVGAFLWAIEKQGMDILEARDFVLRGMVDFNNLTDVERNVVRKYAIPFYSWARNSTPIVFESFFMDNRKWRTLNKIVQAQEKSIVETDEVLPDRLIPEYVARGFNVPVARGSDGDFRYFLFDGWIPQSQLTEIDSVEELFKFVPEQLGPIPKTILELMMGESLFLEKDFAIGNRTYLGRRMPEVFITVLRNVRLLNTVDSLMKAEDGGQTLEQVRRFMTGLNTVRVGRDRAAASYKSRVDDFRQRIVSDMIEAAREGQQDEVRSLALELRRFIQEGR